MRIQIRIFLVLVLPLLLSGCFIADSLFIEDDDDNKELSLQHKAQIAVGKNVESQTKEEKYTPLGFSEITIKKPVELVELEDMEKLYKLTPSDTALKQKIIRQKEYIRENKIERMAEIEHFFTIDDSSENFTVFEATFTLSDTLAVISKSPTIILTLPDNYREALKFYFNEYTIFRASTYTEGKALSRSFYRFFKGKLESYTTVQEKSDFLKHTLYIVKLVRQSGTFDQEKTVKAIFHNYIREKRPEISNYEGLQYSELYETQNNEDKSVLGYYFFHKFIGNYQEKRDTNVVLVEFDPYYQVDNVFQLDGAFEDYTKK